MSPLDTIWHPVATSQEVKKTPVKVQVCQTELVLFRSEEGSIAALHNRCPHRKAQLSCGKVKGGRIHCPYHGWNYDRHGNGASPMKSRKKIRASSFRAQEHAGLIWVTSSRNEAPLEYTDTDGFHTLGIRKNVYEAPLEICVDNLLDQEHTNFTHKVFTFTEPDPDSNKQLHVTQSDGEISVAQSGLRQKGFLNLMRLLGLAWGKYSYDDQRVTFTPPKAIVDLKGKNSPEEESLPFYVRVIQLYVPATENKTLGFTWILSSKKVPFIIAPFIDWLITYELSLDEKVMASIGEEGVDLKGCQLGSYDGGVVRGRKLLKTLYLNGSSESDLAKSSQQGQSVEAEDSLPLTG